jgi:hypothetical protein
MLLNQHIFRIKKGTYQNGYGAYTTEAGELHFAGVFEILNDIFHRLYLIDNAVFACFFQANCFFKSVNYVLARKVDTFTTKGEIITCDSHIAKIFLTISR